MFFMAEFGVLKPVRRKLTGTVRHVLPAEHTEAKHFLRRQFRTKFGIKVLPLVFGKNILISALHQILYHNFLAAHCNTPYIVISLFEIGGLSIFTRTRPGSTGIFDPQTFCKTVYFAAGI